MRCPFPPLIVVALFRIWRQFRYACSEGIAWAIREPRWWWAALRGIPDCLASRHAVPWRIYYAWMKLPRQPTAVVQEPAHVEKAEIGVAATASAEDPGADRQPFDVIERQFPHRVR